MAWTSWVVQHQSRHSIKNSNCIFYYIKTPKDSIKRDTNIQTELQETAKAGAAECTESRRPKPPNRNGKVASDQLLSDMPQCKILIRHSCNLKSNREGKEPREEDGTHRKRWETSQTSRILLSRHNSTWGSSRRTSNLCRQKWIEKLWRSLNRGFKKIQAVAYWINTPDGRGKIGKRTITRGPV